MVRFGLCSYQGTESALVLAWRLLQASQSQLLAGGGTLKPASSTLTPNQRLRVALSSLIRQEKVHGRSCLQTIASRASIAQSELAVNSTMSTAAGDGSVPEVQNGGAVSKSSLAQSQVASRFAPFGQTIFSEISALANKHGAINLGQGFPNFDGPDFIKQAAIQAINEGHGQYARMIGEPPLNAAIAARWQRDTGLEVDPNAEVTVTTGCTEAIVASFMGLVNPGDEVIVFEPAYDSYIASLAMAGATVRPITLRPPSFAVPIDELRATFSSKTRAILINTPHNPTGKVFSRAELETIGSLCKEHDAIALSDEVYHRLLYNGAEHISLATLPGMYERTVTLNSLGKTYSLTGWKVGWAIAPPPLTNAIRMAHQFITFATATPLQYGAVAALQAPDSFYDQVRAEYAQRKDILMEGLTDVGFTIFEPQGSFFVVCDHTGFGYETDVEFCKHLIEHVGVAAIPPSAFYSNPKEGSKLVRFAFCKTEETLREAVRRMKDRLRPKVQI